MTPPRRKLKSLTERVMVDEEIQTDDIKYDVRIHNMKLPLNLDYKRHYYKIHLPHIKESDDFGLENLAD